MKKKLLKIVNNGFGNKDISTEKGYNNYTSFSTKKEYFILLAICTNQFT